MPKSRNKRKRGKHKGKKVVRNVPKKRTGITRGEANALILAGMMEEKKPITRTPNPYAPGMQ